MKSLMITALLLFSSAALALTETEQTLTPRAQQFEVRFGGIYEYTDVSTSIATMTINGFTLPASFYYGINDNNAIGFELGYHSDTSEVNRTVGLDYKTKNKGLKNLEFHYKGKFDLAKGTMFLNGSFNIPPEKATLDAEFGDRSVSTGQMGLSAAVGYTLPLARFNIGGILGYDMNFEGDGTFTSTLNQSYSMKTKGGNTLNAQIFGEIENAFNPNVSLIYKSTAERTYTYQVNNEATFFKLDTLEIRGTLRFIATENLDIIPQISYVTLLNKSDLDADKFNQFAIGADARFLF